MMASRFPEGKKHFVDEYRAELIQWITMVHPVLDNLLQEGLLTQEHYDTVKAKETTQEKMRGLYKFSRGWSIHDKDIFYQHLKASNPGVMEHLVGTSLSANPKMTRLSDITKEYRESTKEMLQRIKEYNSRMGEAVYLQKIFINVLMIKGHQNKEGKEQEIRSSDRIPLQIMEVKSSGEFSPTTIEAIFDSNEDSSCPKIVVLQRTAGVGKTMTSKKITEKRSPITIQALFDPDEDGFIPKIVVLQGAAGIGKTMTSKKIMLDWASGDLYQEKFDFVFYLSCREINTIPGNISLVGLLSRSCRLTTDDLVSILKDPGSQRKLLTIVDGFDELRWTLEEKSEGCLDISLETHKEIILQSLLRKQVLPQSSLIITTRSLAMEKLNTFIDDPRNVEIQGFTREDREEFVHKFFGNKEDADKVLSIIKANGVLYTMCAVPITCWIVCTVIKQEIKKDLALIRCNTMTSIYLLYLEVLLTHHSKKEQSVRRKQTCLKKLCALANQGVLNQQILFEKKDLERHGLSLSEVESVFLNENIFDWDVRTQTCYSFIHLSVQEFLAALYYMLDDWFGFLKGTFLPEICKGKSLRRLSFDYPEFALAVQFLFGLLNENQVKTFSESTGITISLRARPAMIEWAMKNIKGTFFTQTIFCLYEAQDDNLVRSVMSGWPNLELSGSLIGYLWMDHNCSKQLIYCLKTLKSESIQSLYFGSLTADLEFLTNLSPLLHRCQKIEFEDCIISSKVCLEEDKAEDEAESSSEEDKIKPANLSWLINPESKIQEIHFDLCNLSLSCCDDLCSVITTNQTLTKLEILSSERMPCSEVDHYCEVLQNAGCNVKRWYTYWTVSMHRRRLENGLWEAVSPSADDDNSTD